MKAQTANPHVGMTGRDIFKPTEEGLTWPLFKSVTGGRPVLEHKHLS